MLLHCLPRRDRLCSKIKSIQYANFIGKGTKSVNLFWKGTGDFGFEQGEIVVKLQVTARKGNA